MTAHVSMFKSPTATPDVDNFFHRLSQARKRVLLLDYDGTLAPFRINPTHAEPYPGVREQLDAIMDDPRTHVVIVSGRWIQDLLPLLRLRRQPEYWGSHGREQLMPDGKYLVATIDEPVLRQLVLIDAHCDDIELRGGRCERKPGSIAVHWRGNAPEQVEPLQGYLREFWNEHGLAKHLQWCDFDGGVEFRAHNRDKGNVIDAMLEREGPCVAAFLGDDVIDEEGFAAIKGRGLGVLVRQDFRPTNAVLWLRPPEQLLEFLKRWHDACAQGN